MPLAQSRPDASRHGRAEGKAELSARTIQPSGHAGGVKKAVVAVAASILTNAYFILRDGVTYRDFGPDYLGRRDPGTIARRLAKRIEALGFTVDLRPAA
jgi:hypothetical protein